MTIREHLDRQMRRLMAAYLASFAAFAVGWFLAPSAKVPGYFLCVASLAVGLLAMLYGYLVALRCPRCGGPWQSLIVRTWRAAFRVDRRIRYCPFCGADRESVPAGWVAADSDFPGRGLPGGLAGHGKAAASKPAAARRSAGAPRLQRGRMASSLRPSSYEASRETSSAVS